MKFTPPAGMDARQFDPVSGRFICNKQHPWDGNRSSAPKGVQHVDGTDDGVTFKCPNCKTEFKKR